jgi:MSHA biogenesis protein MshJ
MSAARFAEWFNARATRERLLIFAALLALVLSAWDGLLMKPLREVTHGLQAEIAAAGVVGTEVDDGSDPHRTALLRAGELQLRSEQLDSQISGSARGFVPATQMIGVLHDVLRRQGGLSLVSIRNLPVRSLVAPASQDAPPSPPFVHSIELVIDGRYADIQSYVHQLESLPWKFRWSLLELSTRRYPMNRVRLSLSTLSMDATWLGVAPS